jgi:hypothetical protein
MADPSSSAKPAKLDVKPSALLERKLHALGRSLVTVEFGRRLALFIGVTIVLVGVLMLGDWFFEYALSTRRTLLTIAGLIAGALLLRALAALVTQQRDEETLALMVERENPEFHSRLIAAVQFARGKASFSDPSAAPIVQSMIDETETRGRSIAFNNVIDWRWFARALLFLLVVGIVFTAAYFIWHKVTPTLLGRAFLSETAIPRDTRILTVTGDMKTGIGDNLRIEATADGVLPPTGELHVHFASGRDAEYSLVPDPERPGTYAADLEAVPESLTYAISLNDARSTGHTIRAIERPAVASLEGVQTYPEYTAMGETRHLPGDFHLFPGSQFTLHIRANKPVAAATLRLIGDDREVPLVIEPTDGANLSATFSVPAENLSGFSITLRDAEDMDSREPAVYRAQLLGDEPPRVRIVYPRRTEELATRAARFLIAFEATDRFGIAAVSLHYRINEGDTLTQELELEADSPKAVKRQYEWPLAQVSPPLAEGDHLEYWIEARDHNVVEDGTGASEHLFFRVVSSSEKRDDLLSRASDYLGGVGATTDDQQRLNDDLGQFIKAKAKPNE